MNQGLDDLLRQTERFQFSRVLDVGTGSGFAARFFHDRGKQVVVTGYDMDSYMSEPLPAGIRVEAGVDVCHMDRFDDSSFDAVWCSHVLEHVINPGLALAEMRRVLRPQGHLFLIVPEFSPFVVGGHVSVGWNLGILMYVLALSGFDVRNGAFINHCWNVAGFVARGEMPDRVLRYDRGDLETLKDLFPPSIRIVQGFDGDLLEVGWEWLPAIRASAAHRSRQFRLRRLVHSALPPLVRRPFQRRRIQSSTGL
ncbi:MAG TPA: class I SAM-dependent methyltransferase [Microvirga sp.]|nr:class I SAM-dependent methyltransferase [Microvirga sp.]